VPATDRYAHDAPGPDDTAEGVGEGALIGGLAGLLAGVAALAIPGVGPLFVAGALASVVTSTAAGATAGAAAGGILGMLNEAGIPDEQARMYESGIRSGNVLVTVRTNNEGAARDALREAGAIDIEQPMGVNR
jgi:hypothetical protein